MIDLKTKRLQYFDINEEDAVKEFIFAESVELRTIIYETRLKKSIDKLVESIINRYKLHRVGMTFEENHTDTISFLICQANKFKPEKGKKAYSYYGTICKNYLIAEIKKSKIKTNSHYDYDDYSAHLEENDEYSYSIDDDDVNPSVLIKKIVEEIETILNNPDKEAKKLNENEIKLGYALIDIFSNYNTLFDSESKNTKYDKNSILRTIRNYTNLSTKDIRTSLSKYKTLYKVIKNYEIENGSV